MTVFGGTKMTPLPAEHCCRTGFCPTHCRSRACPCHHGFPGHNHARPPRLPGRLDRKIGQRHSAPVDADLVMSLSMQLGFCREHCTSSRCTSCHAPEHVVPNNAARRKRRDTYPELTRARRCRLVIIGIEAGGRFGDGAASFLRLPARQRAAAVPAHLRPAAQAAWVARWAALLAVAAQRAYATSLLELPLAGEVNGDEAVPDLPELLADAGELPVLASRLPVRPL